MGTTQSALDSGAIQKVVNDIQASTDTPVVTVALGGHDAGPGCEPITAAGCNFMHNMRTILNELETALATHPGPHVIKWINYYNPNHNNPFGNPAPDQSYELLGLGADLVLTDCSSEDVSLFGFDDAINCIAKEKGATPGRSELSAAHRSFASQAILHPHDRDCHADRARSFRAQRDRVQRTHPRPLRHL